MNREETLIKEREARLNEVERYPWFVRFYGCLSILAGGVQIALFVLVLLVLLMSDVNFKQLEAVGHGSLTTVVIAIVAMVVSVVLSVMFFVLGVRMVRGKRRRVALLANTMIVLEVVALICHFMLSGLSSALIAPLVNMVILIALQSYSDPALSEERRLQRRLHQLEIRAEAEDGTLGRDVTGRGYITLNFFNLFWVFVICSVIGLGVELAYHMTLVDPGVYQDRAGLLYGPFSPIYGVGAVLMTVALNRFHDKNPIVIFLVSAVIGGAFEFFVSWFMQTAFGITAWDYTGTFLSICGRTNGRFMAMWGVMGFVWIRFVLPIMLRIVNRIPWNWRYAVTTVCALLMFADAGLTLAALDCWYQREGGTMDYKDASFIVDFCNTEYDNDYMENRFQTMTLEPESASRAQ
ncbi:MAG: putative ABC transporter permease [Eggerthellaceae bacterium]|nr:putative ABC transporter permease [Eggerthellaceae bacterium]